MMEIKQTETFASWESKLRTGGRAPSSRQDCVGGGVSELRTHYGPGCRIYFQRRGAVVLVLLCGGDKSSQERDITNAKRLAQEWRD
jgi:putative addiction module killer protein